MSSGVSAKLGPPVASAKAIPSSPTWISTTSFTPFLAQSSYSDSFIRREALAMSGYCAPTPAQNSFMPAPVPVDSTIGAGIAGLALARLSATALANGRTVDEPTARTLSRLADCGLRKRSGARRREAAGRAETGRVADMLELS